MRKQNQSQMQSLIIMRFGNNKIDNVYLVLAGPCLFRANESFPQWDTYL